MLPSTETANAELTAARIAAAAPPADEWRARNENERELLRRIRQLNIRAGRAETAVLQWNGARLIVLTTQQVR